MPEQPPDPRHYDMRIPPPPDPDKKDDSQKPASGSSEEQGAEAQTGRDSGDEKSPSGRGQK